MSDLWILSTLPVAITFTNWQDHAREAGFNPCRPLALGPWATSQDFSMFSI
jgi:hypothetical protein